MGGLEFSESQVRTILVLLMFNESTHKLQYSLFGSLIGFQHGFGIHFSWSTQVFDRIWEAQWLGRISASS